MALSFSPEETVISIEGNEANISVDPSAPAGISAKFRFQNLAFICAGRNAEMTRALTAG